MTLHSLNLRGRAVLVVGGEPSAAVRCRELLAEGAEVRVVAPHLCEELQDLYAQEPGLVWRAGDARPSDLDDVWLVSVQDTDARRDGAIVTWCDERRIFCEGGAAPTVRTVASAELDGTTVAVDAPEESQSRAVLAQMITALHEGAVALPRPQTGRGKVVLVGGGPGHTDLITLRARRELARADVVVTDRLAPIGVLKELGQQVEVIDVGKTPHHHPIPQDEINRILVERASRGQYVVRLKGGDPFVLGRGGEELLACRAAGVDVEVIPGVTSALAAPLAADIPVTHRGSSTGFLVISGHDDLQTSMLAGWTGTIVVLMGMSRLRELSATLQRDGRPSETPAAVVHKAWTPEQQVVRGTLADIADRVATAGFANPSVIVIGDVATVLADADQG